MKYIEARIKEPSTWAAAAAIAAVAAIMTDQFWVIVIALVLGVAGALLKERKE
jgi:predicted branched-subunit amino acid permease